MEEKKKFSIINYLWVIPLILGIVIGIIGILKINSANNMFVPDLGDDGWFEAETSQSNAEFGGIAMCMIGFFGVGLMGSIMCFSIPRAVRASKKHMKSFGTYINDNIIQPAKEKVEGSSEKLKKCKYCGSLAKLDATECESCGGNEFEKHKIK